MGHVGAEVSPHHRVPSRVVHLVEFLFRHGDLAVGRRKEVLVSCGAKSSAGELMEVEIIDSD